MIRNVLVLIESYLPGEARSDHGWSGGGINFILDTQQTAQGVINKHPDDTVVVFEVDANLNEKIMGRAIT